MIIILIAFLIPWIPLTFKGIILTIKLIKLKSDKISNLRMILITPLYFVPIINYYLHKKALDEFYLPLLKEKMLYDSQKFYSLHDKRIEEYLKKNPEVADKILNIATLAIMMDYTIEYRFDTTYIDGNNDRFNRLHCVFYKGSITTQINLIINFQPLNKKAKYFETIFYRILMKSFDYEEVLDYLEKKL